MAFRPIPNKRRGEFTGDGREPERLKRRALRQVRRLQTRGNLPAARALLNRVQAAFGGSGGAGGVTPRGTRRRARGSVFDFATATDRVRHVGGTIVDRFG